MSRFGTFAACGVTLGLSLLGCGQKAEGGTASMATASASPIRIVRHEFLDLAHAWAALQTASASCRVAKHLPDAELPAWDDATKQSHFIVRTEELFDGDKHAVFGATSVLIANPDNNCALEQRTTWQAEASVGCKAMWEGRVDWASEPPNVPQLSEGSTSRTTCAAQGAKPADATLPPDLKTKDVGRGASCFLLSDQLAAKLRQPMGDRTHADACLYTKQPYYRGNADAAVMLQHSAGTVMDAEFAKPLADRQPHPMESSTSVLDDFSDGTAIPADRFTQAAVEAWVHQPTSKVVQP